MRFWQLRGNYSRYNAFDYAMMMLTCPLPFFLNTYWFTLLIKGLLEFLSKGPRSH